MPQNLNVGLGKDYSIDEYYKRITKLMDFNCSFDYGLTKPIGMRKLIDNKMLKEFGWKPKFTLNHGLKSTINYYNEIKNIIVLHNQLGVKELEAINQVVKVEILLWELTLGV